MFPKIPQSSLGILQHYLQGFIHSRWLFGISSTNSIILQIHWTWHHMTSPDISDFSVGNFQCAYVKCLKSLLFTKWLAAIHPWYFCSSLLGYTCYSNLNSQIGIPMLAWNGLKYSQLPWGPWEWDLPGCSRLRSASGPHGGGPLASLRRRSGGRRCGGALGQRLSGHSPRGANAESGCGNTALGGSQGMKSWVPIFVVFLMFVEMVGVQTSVGEECNWLEWTRVHGYLCTIVINCLRTL